MDVNEVQPFGEEDGSVGGWFMTGGENFGIQIANSQVDVELLAATAQLERLSSRYEGTELFAKLDLIEREMDLISDDIESLFIRNLENDGSQIGEGEEEVKVDLYFTSISLFSNLKIADQQKNHDFENTNRLHGTAHDSIGK